MSIQLGSIPTLYSGIVFRSRLEAKYASFFDLCGWRWDYEPFDFNGWIPDFSIGELPTLVEIKPFYEHDDWTEAVDKIASSGCREPVILLGASPTFSLANDIDTPVIGSILEPNEIGFERWDLNFGYTAGNDKLGLCPMSGGWKNYIWRVPEKRTRHPAHPNKWSCVWDGLVEVGEARRNLIAFWSRACNASQWRKPNDF